MIMTTKQSPRLLLELVELVDEPHGPDQLQQPAEAQRLRAAAGAGGGGAFDGGRRQWIIFWRRSPATADR